MALKPKIAESTEAEEPVAHHTEVERVAEESGPASDSALPVASVDTEKKIRLDLGCGDNRLKGWIGYDLVGPNVKKVDIIHDLEKTPWPGKEGTHVSLAPWDGRTWMWPESSVDEARFHFSLEYMAGTSAALRGIFAELHRVLRPGGLVFFDFLNPRHPSYLDDPDVVRAVTPGLLERMPGFKRIGHSETRTSEPLHEHVVLEAVKLAPGED